MPVGITPQEHNGKGMPNIEGSRDDFNGEPLKDCSMYLLGMKTCNIPAKRNPSNNQGAISLRMFRNSFPKLVMYNPICVCIIQQCKESWIPSQKAYIILE